MKAAPLALLGSGVVSSAGLDAASTCAALRAGLAGFSAMSVCDRAGEALQGARVPTGFGLHGKARQLHLLQLALRQCCEAADARTTVALMLCLPDADERAEPWIIEPSDIAMLERAPGQRFDAHTCAAFRHGRAGVVPALLAAREWIVRGRATTVCVAGVDSLLGKRTLTRLERNDRLLTSVYRDGFIPGEAASAILVGRAGMARAGDPAIVGLFGAYEEAYFDSGKPLRGEGLMSAMRGALDEAGCTLDDVALRIADVSGEQFGFKETALAMTRMLRRRREDFPLWHPAEGVGETGAAIGPLAVAVAMAALHKGYAPGEPILCHFSGDSGARGALVVQAVPGAAR